MKQKAIQELKNWSEEAINVAELESSDIPVDKDFLCKDLKKIVLFTKESGMDLEEIKELVWNHDLLTEKYFNE